MGNSLPAEIQRLWPLEPWEIPRDCLRRWHRNRDSPAIGRSCCAGSRALGLLERQQHRRPPFAVAAIPPMPNYLEAAIAQRDRSNFRCWEGVKSQSLLMSSAPAVPRIDANHYSLLMPCLRSNCTYFVSSPNDAWYYSIAEEISYGIDKSGELRSRC